MNGWMDGWEPLSVGAQNENPPCGDALEGAFISTTDVFCLTCLKWKFGAVAKIHAIVKTTPKRRIDCE